MPALLGQTWRSILRPLGFETLGFTSCLRALSRSTHQASDDVNNVNPPKQQLQHEYDPERIQDEQKLASNLQMSQAERNRLRYHTDREYRERVLEHNRKYFRKRMLDPKFGQKRSEYVQEYLTKRKEDEGFRRHSYAIQKRSHDRRFADDAVRQHYYARESEYQIQRLKVDPQFNLVQQTRQVKEGYSKRVSKDISRQL